MKKKVMKKIMILCGALLAGLITPEAEMSAQSPQPTIIITLEDALEIALSESNTIQIADMEITKQRWAKKGTYASLYPNIDFSLSFQRTLEPQVMSMDFGGVQQTIKVGTDNSWATGFSATMPIVSVALWKNLKLSALEVDLAIEKARESRIDMIDQIKRAYYGVLLAEDSHEVFRQAYENAVENYNETLQKYNQGVVAEYDLIRSDVNVKNAEPNMYDAENMIILAKWQLKALMGIDLDLDIECAGTLGDYENYLVSYRVNPDMPLDDNTILRQLDIQEDQLRKVKQIQIAQYYPSLNAQFSYQWMSLSDNSPFAHQRWNPYSFAGVSISVPIFSGGKRYSDVKQADVNLRQLRLSMEDTERNLRVALKQASDQMNTSIKQYYAAKAGVAQSEKSYDITAKRYETGVGTILEINDAQLSLTQAQLNLNQAIYNYLVAKSTLEKTIGIDEY